MRTYTIEVNDNVLENFLRVLNNFSKNDVKIIESMPKEPVNKVVENDSLSGMFAHYVTHRLSDEEIEEGIVEGAYGRAMRGLND
ncbi:MULTISPECIES: hypothetical protein [Moraxella]|uniref:Uncharacterized protein n=2 Tax=Moraxella lacunata TaxID=477 RepID=A0A1B8Q6K7_MORLA|nr:MULTISPECIES: hypothetical protein [Moraxella]MBE9578762.1 hypothetical protein [Moraxella sp. K1664]MBE9588092.1 hypothetical protein [Moraxella sp. K1630]MBE9589666.1 hypothetical protein [Moraxella sp. K127]MBE9596166.1 hypothetical protein [Moraxella sp. K2450]MDH9218617.1 hypothetical protein [Moraxella lacunata]